MKLEGKSVVVTGASSGMGKAIVELFVKEGANVVAVARRKARLDELAASLEGQAGRVVPYAGDISKEQDCEGAILQAIKSFGRLDILVNNAGVMDDMSPIGDATNQKMEQVFQINVFGPMYTMRKAVQVLSAAGRRRQYYQCSLPGRHADLCRRSILCFLKPQWISISPKTLPICIYPKGSAGNAIAPGGINTEISNSDGYAQRVRLWTREKCTWSSSACPRFCRTNRFSGPVPGQRRFQLCQWGYSAGRRRLGCRLIYDFTDMAFNQSKSRYFAAGFWRLLQFFLQVIL